jgi:hypothetical protein
LAACFCIAAACAGDIPGNGGGLAHVVERLLRGTPVGAFLAGLIALAFSFSDIVRWKATISEAPGALLEKHPTALVRLPITVPFASYSSHVKPSNLRVLPVGRKVRP